MRLFISFIALAAMSLSASAQWQIAGQKITSKWAGDVTPASAWQQYPRPQLERSEWKCLNGLWDYGILALDASEPEVWDGKILVPFALESALSGVGKRIDDEHVLMYHTSFTIPSSWNGRRIMLNFGAVDWRADIELNGIQVGQHLGGFTPFSCDITDAIAGKGEQKLTVRVWDPTDGNNQPVGKQRRDPKRIWYTPVTGIWQTVWIEPVGKANHVIRINPVADLRRSELDIDVMCARNEGIVSIEAYDGDAVVASARAVAGTRLRLHIPGARLWDTADPFLYRLRITLAVNGRTVDTADSYAAFRTVDVWRDPLGHKRVRLNGRPIFMYGPLDQGWWPDGLLTAPSDEALASDVTFTKEIGFNTIRKHIKVEPDRWYYHCDRAGILVWQDMPSGHNDGYVWARNNVGAGSDKPLTEAEKSQYLAEFREMMEFLRFHPSIVVWVPFNEAWSQFDTEKVTAWVREMDPTRLINPASGGNLRPCGDIIDIHHYPEPTMPVHDSERVVVLGEYGGIGYPIEGHLWNNSRKNWGYVKYSSSEEVTDEYVRFAEKIIPFISEGMSSAIYTQTTDVESEVNGFLTYDRKVMKMDRDRIREVNRKVINSLK